MPSSRKSFEFNPSHDKKIRNLSTSITLFSSKQAKVLCLLDTAASPLSLVCTSSVHTYTHHPPELFQTGHHHCVCCCGLCCTCSISILYCIISSALQCSVCPSQLHSDWCNVVVLLELYCTVTFHSSISIYALQIY